MVRVYKEKQEFRQWWIWLLISPMVFLALFIIVKQLIMGEPVGDQPLPDIGVYLFALFVFLIVYLIWFLRLETKIDEKGISMNYRPALKRFYAWKDIEKTEIINYGFVGYGFRWWPKHGWIYNVGGNMGLKIYLKSGKKFVIGTQESEALGAFLEGQKDRLP